jgi:hypothetical protein
MNLYPPGFKHWPKIDALPKDFPDRDKIIALYLQKAEEVGFLPKIWDWACGCNFYPGYHKATELLVEDLLIQGWWPKQIKQLLQEMQSK